MGLAEDFLDSPEDKPKSFAEQFLDDESVAVSPETGMGTTNAASGSNGYGMRRPERTVSGTIKDIGVTAAKGVVGAGEAAVGLADIPTLGYAGKALNVATGYDPKATQQFLSEQYSPAQQAANLEVDKANGFVDTARAMVENPSTIAHSAIETAPLMLSGGAIARGVATKAVPALAKTASGLIKAGAIGEGAVTAGSMAESMRQESPTGTITPGQSAAAVGAGIGASVIGLAGARIANKLNFADPDTMLAGLKREGKKLTSNEVAKSIIGGGISEGVFEELPQSAQEQVWQNAATGKPLFEGVPESMAQGALVGGVMGSGANIVSLGGGDKSKEGTVGGSSDEPPKPPAGPVSKAVESAGFGMNRERAANIDSLFSDAQGSQRELMSDFEEQGRDVAEQTGARNRAAKFKGMQENIASLDRNLAPPVRPETSALAQQVELTPAQIEAEKRAQREDDLKSAFSDMTPDELRAPLADMQRQLADAEGTGIRIQRADGSYDGVDSTTPEWFKQESRERYDKVHGTKISKNLSRGSFNRVLDLVRSGKELAPGQQEIWDYLKESASGIGGLNSESVRVEKQIEKEGIEWLPPQKVVVGDLSTGDKVIVEKNGAPDIVEVKGRDEDGNILLEDGATFRLDDFDKLEIFGIKRKQKEVQNVRNVQEQGQAAARGTGSGTQTAGISQTSREGEFYSPSLASQGDITDTGREQTTATGSRNAEDQAKEGRDAGYSGQVRGTSEARERDNGPDVTQLEQQGLPSPVGSAGRQAPPSPAAPASIDQRQAPVTQTVAGDELRETPSGEIAAGTSPPAVSTKGEGRLEASDTVSKVAERQQLVDQKVDNKTAEVDNQQPVRLTKEQPTTLPAEQRTPKNRAGVATGTARQADVPGAQAVTDPSTKAAPSPPADSIPGPPPGEKSPGVSDEPAKLSKTTTPGTGTTIKQVERSLRRLLGRGFDRMKAAGKVEVVRTAQGLPKSVRGNALFMTAWHGSPHRFDKFSTDKIGTGEGAQSYGWGLYFASSREVADWYRDKLTGIGSTLKSQDWPKAHEPILRNAVEAISNMLSNDADIGSIRHNAILKAGRAAADSIEKLGYEYATNDQGDVVIVEMPKGALYQVELAPADDEYLLWDRPLSEQSEKVRKAIKDAGTEEDLPVQYSGAAAEKMYWGEKTGQDFYAAVSSKLGDQATASKVLHSYGIRGIKYLDGTSRNTATLHITPPTQTVSGKWMVKSDDYNSQGKHFDTEEEAKAYLKEEQERANFNFVIFSDSDVEIKALYSKDGDVVGAYYQGKIYLVADRMTPEDVPYVATHEFSHLLLDQDSKFIAKKEKILADFAALRATSKRVQDAYAMVPEDTAAENVDAEALAYYLQIPKNHNHSIFRRVIAAVKSALFRLGLPTGKLTEADFVAIFTSGMKRFANRATVKENLTVGELAPAMKSVKEKQPLDIADLIPDNEPGKRYTYPQMNEVKDENAERSIRTGFRGISREPSIGSVHLEPGGVFQRITRPFAEKAGVGLGYFSDKENADVQYVVTKDGDKLKVWINVDSGVAPESLIAHALFFRLKGSPQYNTFVAAVYQNSPAELKKAYQVQLFNNPLYNKFLSDNGIKDAWSIPDSVVAPVLARDLFGNILTSGDVWIRAGFENTQVATSQGKATGFANRDLRYHVKNIKNLNDLAERAADLLEVGLNKKPQLSVMSDAVRSAMDKVHGKEGMSAFEKAYKYLADRMYPVSKLQSQLGKQRYDADYLEVERARGKVTAWKIQRFRDDVILPLLDHLAKNKLTITDMEELAYVEHVPEANERLRRTNAKIRLDALKAQHTEAEWREYNDAMLSAGGTTAAVQDEYLAIIDRIGAAIPEYEAKVNQMQVDLAARVFTEEERENGTLERAQRKVDNAKRRLENQKRIIDRWNADKDQLSGMTDEQASAIETKWKKDSRYAKNKEAVRQLRKINDKRLDLLYAAGELSKDEYTAIKETYKNYVPLYREGYDDQKAPVGHGGGPLGKPIKVRAGSTREVVNVFAHTVDNMQAAIMREEKAKAHRALFNMVQDNPDAGWEIGQVKKEETYDNEGNLKQYPSLNEADNELHFKVEGERKILRVPRDNKTLMEFIDSIKGTDDAQIGPILQGAYKINRILAMLNTTWAPEFVMSNFARDIQTALVNMTGTEAENLHKRVLKRIGGAIKEIWQDEMGQKESAVYRDFGEHGGKISWASNYENIEELAKDLEKDYSQSAGTDKLKKLRKLKKFVESSNTAVENGIRLALYAELTGPNGPKGMTKRRAANIASNLTVDFTRKGSGTPAINALYLFFNAGLQGNVRMFKAITRSPKVRKIGYGIIGAGAANYLLGMAMAGDDDDGENRYEKLRRSNPSLFERNMIFMIPGTDGKYIKIPMPYLYNSLFLIGNEAAAAATSLVTGSKYRAGEGAANIAKAIANSVNPLQAATLLQTLAPTLADPIIQVYENKAWHGGPLMPEKNPFGTPKPDSERYFPGVNKIAKYAAQGLSRATGGDSVQGGLIDISPETLEMITETFTGSLGRFIKDTTSLPVSIATGELEAKKVPFIRRVYGEKTQYDDYRIYRSNIDEVLMLKERYEAADAEKKKEFRSDARFRLIPLAQNTEKIIKALGKTIRRYEEEGRDATALKDRQSLLQKKFNTRYNKV